MLFCKIMLCNKKLTKNIDKREKKMYNVSTTLLSNKIMRFKQGGSCNCLLF